MMKNNVTTASTRLVADLYSQQYQQLNNKNIDSMLDLMSDDIEWYIPGDVKISPWVGKRQGKKEVKTFFELQQQHFTPLDAQISKTFVDEEQAVLVGHFSIRLIKTGKIYSTHFMIHLTVENNKIIKYLFLEDSLGLIDASIDNTRNIELIEKYFKYTDERTKGIEILFSEDAELFYPKLGIVKGREGVQKFGAGFSDLVSLSHEIEDFIYHIDGDLIVVEGTESGVLQNGKTFSKSKFCSVFTIKDNLIVRLHIYVDPDFGGEDTQRLRWK